MLKPIEAGCQALAVPKKTPPSEVTVKHFVGKVDPYIDSATGEAVILMSDNLWHVDPPVTLSKKGDRSVKIKSNLIDESRLMRIDGDFETIEEQTDELSY